MFSTLLDYLPFVWFWKCFLTVVIPEWLSPSSYSEVAFCRMWDFLPISLQKLELSSKEARWAPCCSRWITSKRNIWSSCTMCVQVKTQDNALEIRFLIRLVTFWNTHTAVAARWLPQPIWVLGCVFCSQNLRWSHQVAGLDLDHGTQNLFHIYPSSVGSYYLSTKNKWPWKVLLKFN